MPRATASSSPASWTTSPATKPCWSRSPRSRTSIRPRSNAPAQRSEACGNGTCPDGRVLPGLPGTTRATRPRCPHCYSPRVVRHAELDTLTIAMSIATPSTPLWRSATTQPRRQAGDRRRRQARRGVDRLLHRPHLRRALGDADVQGAAALSARGRHPPGHGKYAGVGREVRELMLELTPQVEPMSIDEAFLDLPARAAARHHRRRTPSPASRPRSRAKSASASRSGSPPTSFWPRSPPTSTSRAALLRSARAETLAFLRTSRCR